MYADLIRAAIEEIIRKIKKGYLFDSHTIISILIKEHSDLYLGFAHEILPVEKPTLTVHNRIGHIIKEFNRILVEEQQDKAWSENIHGTLSECTCWKRIEC